MRDWRDVSVWERLAADGSNLIASAEESLAPGESMPAPAAIARLRRTHDHAMVAAAFELVAARRKARGRLVSASTLWCDLAGVEQASGTRVATWKASRMRTVLGAGGELFDLCAGIGGDSMALAAAGLRVTAVDIDPRRTWMAARNAGVATQVADVETIDVRDRAFHADPARRDEQGARRTWTLDDHRPGRAWMERALREGLAGAIKLSPGVDRHLFESARMEWEWIEDDGTLVQAVAWSGLFAQNPGETRATILAASGVPRTIVGVPDDTHAHTLAVDSRCPIGLWLCEPCAALERARLLSTAVGTMAAREVSRGAGLLVCEHALPTPWFESFRIVAHCEPNAQDIARVIGESGLVARSVRVRGAAADADMITKALRCRPSGTAVVFFWRADGRPRAVVAEHVSG
jgi:hypothetical protein